MDILAFEAEMIDQLINAVVEFVFPIQVIIHGTIRLGLRVCNDECASDCEIEFGRRESRIICEFLSNKI